MQAQEDLSEEVQFAGEAQGGVVEVLETALIAELEGYVAARLKELTRCRRCP